MLLFDPLWILLSALFALLIDRLFGEFLNQSHPVIGIGKLISAFEKHAYRASLLRGGLLVIWVIAVCLLLAVIVQMLILALPLFWSILLGAIIGSIFLAHRMLHDSVSALLHCEQPQQPLSMLVSRDTAQLSTSECYRAGIETYAENLSDGVIAPLFYFLLFGLAGLVIYKAINTLDSMVGYRTPRYEKFGKIAARLDDIANWLPARFTAILLLLLNHNLNLKAVWQQARGHASPNAGYPIAAMAWLCKAQLGGPTSYFGQLEHKPWFGQPHDVQQVEAEHLRCALAQQTPVDLSLILLILLGLLIYVLP
ncbi:MAG: adenosylcobinamide-phosphate synthase CbiB [Thiomicrospira sp.]